MSSLYDIGTRYAEFFEMSEEMGPDDELFFDTWLAIDGELEEKLVNSAKWIKSQEGLVTTLDEEIARLQQKKQVAKNGIERTKRAMEFGMRGADRTKVKTDLFSFNIQKNPVSVFISDEALVPEEFKVPQPAKIDKKKIKEFLEAGNECNFAELNQTESIRIR